MYRSDFVDARGTRLHYLQWESAGPPIVFVHASGHCGGVFEPLGDRLAPGFSVVALDGRGHGLSDNTDTYTWPEMRDDISLALKALDLRRVVLVGHSGGGGVALLAAAALPERVRGVIAFEPGVPFGLRPSPPADWDAFIEERSRRRTRFASREEVLSHFRGRGAFAEWRDEYLRAFIKHGVVESADGGVDLACAPRVEALLVKLSFDSTAWDIPPCSTPVHIVSGDRSTFARERDLAAPIRPLFPNLRTSVAPGCTHWGPMERPDLFEASIREFIGDLG